MTLTDSLYSLKNRFPDTHRLLTDRVEEPSLVTLADSASGGSTLYVERDGGTLYLHSKYNPKHEAEKFMEQYQEMEHDHVLFYGVGLGYHIRIFTEQHPTVPFSVYEPDREVFRHFISQNNLKEWPQLKHIYLEEHADQCYAHTQNFVEKTNGNSFVITLPSYERVFSDRFSMFAKYLQGHLQEIQKMLQLRHAFEKKWIFNGMDNVRFSIKSNNIFEKRSYFEGKPVLIVAAGPSLVEEIEHLRHIKDNKLAYIFAVGSAINSLLHHGIKPDGTCTYDPHFHNVNVIRKIIDEQINDIPLIYGTTVGFGTLAEYPGPKLYAITSRDGVAQLLLRDTNGNELEKLEDAPSIAVVALQLFYSLGSNRIILVGQNLGYRDNNYYATGIQYGDRGSALSDHDLKNALQVEDVHGDYIQTNWAFNQMRMDMEQFTTRYTDIDIINTTQGGAKIKGTRFMALRDVVSEYFNTEVVDSDWIKGEPTALNLEYLEQKCLQLQSEYEKVRKLLESSVEIFRELERSIKNRNMKKTNKLIEQFNDTFTKIQQNEFYTIILKPMNLLQLEMFVLQFDTIRLETNVFVKARRMIEKFGKLIYDLLQDVSNIELVFLRMRMTIREVVSENSSVRSGS